MGNESICVPRLVRTMTDEETVSSPSQNAIGDRGLELSSASQEAPRGRTYPLLTVGEIRERLEEMREKRRKEEEQEEPGELGEPGEPRAPGERITQFRSPDDSDRSHKEWRETFNKTARELRSFRLSLRCGVLESRRAANVKRNGLPLPHDENNPTHSESGRLSRAYYWRC